MNRRGPQCATVTADGIAIRIGYDVLPICRWPDDCKAAARCFWRAFHELNAAAPVAVAPTQSELEL